MRKSLLITLLQKSRASLFVSIVSAAVFTTCASENKELDGPESALSADVELGSERRLTIAGSAPKPARGFNAVVVLLPSESEPEPQSMRTAPPLATEADTPSMDQFGRAFFPEVLIARAGKPVEFSNSENDMHNVHARSERTGETIFNVATPGYKSYSFTFDEPGAYNITCDVHSEMEAYVYVTESAFAAVASKTGEFSISGVPPGTYTVTVWSAKEEGRSVRVLDFTSDMDALDLASPVRNEDAEATVS